MTKLMFDIAKMAGKEGKMGVLNPLIRQGLGSGQYSFIRWKVILLIVLRGRPGCSFLGVR